MEAIYRGCGMNLKQCSRCVTFIPADPDSVRITRPLNQLHAEDENDSIWMTGVIDRYLARPSTPHFDNMCLATFVSEYEVASRSTSTNVNSEQDNNVFLKQKQTTTKYHLTNNLGTISKRRKPAVIRYTRFNKENNIQKHYFTLIKLYLPHRTLTFDDKIDYQQLFQAECELIIPNMTPFEKLSDEIDEAWQLVQKGIDAEDAWAIIAPNHETQRGQDGEEMEQLRKFEELAVEEIPDLLPQCNININIPTNQIHIKRTVLNSNAEHATSLQSLNNEQVGLLHFIRDWALKKANDENCSPFHIFLTRGAGTGKSHLIRCIHTEVENIIPHKSENPECPVVLQVAYTGTAAFNIDGQTIHSALSITKDMKKTLGEDQANTQRCHLQDLQLLIIDEVSMVSPSMLNVIHSRLQQIKQPSDRNVYFGNISLLAVGDFYQTPPVASRTLLSSHNSLTDIWNALFYKYELHDIIRQKGDTSFMNLLNRLRTRDKTQRIQDEDSKLLQSRLISKHDSGFPKEVLHVAATHAQLREHNEYMLKQIPDSTERFSLTAADTCTDKQSHRTYLRRDPIITDKTSLPINITLCVGARVMLTTNIDVQDGLTNGAMGTVTKIVKGKSTLGLPEAVCVLFDNENIGAAARQKQSLPANVLASSTLIHPHKEVIQRKPLTVTRHQYPFILAWSVTIHKVQGMTNKNIAVSLSGIFKPGMGYVALSRVTSLNGLYLIKEDYDENKMYCDMSVHQALQAMPDAKTLPQWTEQVNLTSLDGQCIITSHNIEGLIPNLQDFAHNSVSHQSDIIALQETWTDYLINTPLPNHNIHLQPRNYSGFAEVPDSLKTTHKGGVGFFIHQDFGYQLINTEHCGIECIAAKFPSIQLSIFNIYRPPQLPLPYFIRQLKCTKTIRHIQEHCCWRFQHFN